MSSKSDLFRSSLSVPMFENINQSLFKLFQTPKYQNYTDVVFSTLGKELENYFGKDMIFKYRYKSKKSFTNNVLKDSFVNESFGNNINKSCEDMQETRKGIYFSI